MTVPDILADFNALIEESINLELNVSELYFLFFEIYPGDAEFWWQLVEEEKNHAALLRSGREYFKPVSKFPDRLIYDNKDELSALNATLRTIIDDCRKKQPDRAHALNTAYAIEHSAGELHFQKFMEKTTDTNTIEQIFIRLNRDDHNHAERIATYMKKNGIEINKENTLF